MLFYLRLLITRCITLLLHGDTTSNQNSEIQTECNIEDACLQSIMTKKRDILIQFGDLVLSTGGTVA